MKIKASLLAAAMLLGVSPLTAYAETDVTEPPTETETAAETVEETTEEAAETETEAETEEETEAEAEEETEETTEEKFKTEDGMFSYKINEDGSVRIFNYNVTGFPGEVVVPSEIDGRPVTKLSNATFMNAFAITSVVLPASLTELGDSVFFGCSSLESIRVEEGNTAYKSEDGILFTADGKTLYCYPAAKADTQYTIPDTVNKLSPSCFAYAENLKHMNIPDSIGFIPGWGFAYSNLETITLADSVTEIDDYAFAYCKSLKDIDFGEGLVQIYNASFLACESLTEITIPASLTRVGQYAFAGAGMREVTIPPTVSVLEYCSFGYTEDMFAISDFVIRGYVGSAAQTYCTTEDSENDYKNDFVFLEIEDEAEDIPVPSKENTPAAEQETETSSVSAAPAQNSGNRLGVILGICGGVVVVLAGVLAALLLKKPKNTESVPEQKPEAAEETKSASDEESV